MDDAFMTTTTNKFYNDETPWAAPSPNADDSIFHTTATTATTVVSPMVRSFTGTLEIGFTVTSTDEVNVSTLLKRFLSFARLLYPTPPGRRSKHCMAEWDPRNKIRH
jgi:hypothetical protein